MNNNLSSKNYFEIFEMPVSFTIDLDTLNNNYRALQSVTHPDRFASAGASERLVSLQQTSLINEAYAVLKKPVERATYMLTLVGVEKNNGTGATLNAEFLTEQMELRESLGDVRAQADPVQTLDELYSSIRSRLDKEMKLFASFYKASEIDNAQSSVTKMQFLVKAMSEIDDLTIELEDELDS